jgi:hypothetical protein
MPYNPMKISTSIISKETSRQNYVPEDTCRSLLIDRAHGEETLMFVQPFNPLWKSNVHCHIHENLPQDGILGQL